MTVYKFGGTSVEDADRIKRAAQLVLEATQTPVVVVSAMSGVTELLSEINTFITERKKWGCRAHIKAIESRHFTALDGLEGASEDTARCRERLSARIGRLHECVEARLREPEASIHRGHLRMCDRILSAGEDLSAELMAEALCTAGAPAEVVDARAVVRTDDRHGEARPLDVEIRRQVKEQLIPLLRENVIPVMQGFVGATETGETTTLGRGGSDLTAAIIGAALNSSEIQIWTDVAGLLSGDPRAVDGASILPEIGFEEAVELAYFGAKVIHPGAAKHALSRNVSIWIRNSFEPNGPGTLIHPIRKGSARVAAIAHKPSVILIKVRAHLSSLEYGFLARVFEILTRHKLPVDLVATSHSSTAFTIDVKRNVDTVVRELEAFADVDVVRDLATITVVGHGLLAEPGINARVFWAVGEEAPIHLISQASDVSLSFLVAEADATAVVRRLHASLIKEETGGA